jgi:hypothetical protein
MRAELSFFDTISEIGRRTKGICAGLSLIPILLICALLSALPSSGARALDPALLTVGIGSIDINGNDTTGTVSVEYTGGKRLFWELKPMGGLMATFDSALYVYGGVAVDVFLGKRLVLTPSFAPGLYFKGGSMDLGHVIEFRSSVKFAYRFQNRARLGLDFYHLSNAGLDESNPGTNALMLTYSIPLGPPTQR